MTIFTATAAMLREADPMNQVIGSLLDYETESMRWLRERSAAIAKAHAEMLAERAADQSNQENDR